MLFDIFAFQLGVALGHLLPPDVADYAAGPDRHQFVDQSVRRLQFSLERQAWILLLESIHPARSLWGWELDRANLFIRSCRAFFEVVHRVEERFIMQVAKLRAKGMIGASKERSSKLFVEQRLGPRRRSVVAEEGKRAIGSNALRARKFTKGK